MSIYVKLTITLFLIGLLLFEIGVQLDIRTYCHDRWEKLAKVGAVIILVSMLMGVVGFFIWLWQQ